ncbi:MAG: nucleotidyltransferase domain-containing protein [Actinomycetota bacterium]|nr:nucleotidyltransferase domain-containing protein [Actinomycetota bacterium]
MTTPAEVVARRRRERGALLELARQLADNLDPALGVRGVVVFGSAARGDFNAASDVDVLVVADHLPDRPLDRLRALGRYPPRVEAVAWTPPEWEAQLARRNPIAVEARQCGIWLVGGFDLANPSGD